MAFHPKSERDVFNANAPNAPDLNLKLITGTAAAIGSVTLDNPGAVANGRHKFIISGLTGETITIKGGVVGGLGTLSAALAPLDATTMLPVASTNLGNGTYVIPKRWKYFGYKFTKSNTSETGVIAWGSVSYRK